ncbi:MAG TPA: hypothetical protein VHQ01_00725 [Pyrinomonadaceae bacterium]|jgi:predicted DNA-binding protein|nr:hypothetical protein [Pyrinomonadaceae bacterium]
MGKRAKEKDGATVHLGIRIDAEDKQTLDQMAEEGHRRITDEVRHAVKKHIKEWKDSKAKAA